MTVKIIKPSPIAIIGIKRGVKSPIRSLITEIVLLVFASVQFMNVANIFFFKKRGNKS